MARLTLGSPASDHILSYCVTERCTQIELYNVCKTGSPDIATLKEQGINLASWIWIRKHCYYIIYIEHVEAVVLKQAGFPASGKIMEAWKKGKNFFI